MAMGECSAYSSLQRTSLYLRLRVVSNLALTDFHSEDPSEFSHVALHYDSMIE